jgi:hypothetical protein
MPILFPTIPSTKLTYRIYDDLITTSTPPAIPNIDFFLTCTQKNFYLKENNTVSQVTIDFLGNDSAYKINGIYKTLPQSQTSAR